ncbi:hypothetical protein CBM2586_B30036 [Cupriavidus phytorum]|uniref:Uncharacterized protein n=1 Tax=Cupriavidus taiwanensis TaxID=164546 RepID=A0A975XJK9_9BURK|nr:hypothetical protein CBM2586_B30036 [Cupriavidus taiwanensis]
MTSLMAARFFDACLSLWLAAADAWGKRLPFASLVF